MSRDKVLPPKLNIKQVTDYLEIDIFDSPSEKFCDFINYGDFKLYKADGAIVSSVSFEKKNFLFDSGESLFRVELLNIDGSEDKTNAAYTADEFYCLRDEVIQFMKNNIGADVLPKNPVEIPPFIPVYLDKASPFYAPEIDLAIQLHKAIQINGYGPHLDTREARVSDWLDNHRPKMKQKGALLARLSGIIKKEK